MARCKEHITQNSIQDNDDIETSWEKVKTNITKASKEAIGTRTVNQNTYSIKKPWFTTEVKIIKEKKNAYIKYKSHQTQETHENYITTRNRVNSRVREIKEEYWRRFISEMEHDMYGSQNRIWKLLRGLKKTTNESIQLKSITEETWTKHFGELYKRGNEQEEQKIEQQETEEDTQEALENLTEEQVKNALKKLKNRKTPNEDRICNEQIKYAGEHTAQEYTKLFNKILKEGKIPEEWSKTTLPIYKKGDKAEPTNYRRITLWSTSLKLLTSIIASEISTKIPINEEQQGLRRNHSTTDALFIIRHIREKATEYNTPAFLCFVDLMKAFDRIQLNVINALQKKNTRRGHLKLIKDLNTPTKEIATTSGIRQGASLSPLLFNTVRDEIKNEVKKAGSR